MKKLAILTTLALVCAGPVLGACPSNPLDGVAWG
jgi:hypothetical protein